MKTYSAILAAIFSLSILFNNQLSAQENETQNEQTENQQIVQIIKEDGGEFTGVILHQDAREVILQSNEMGEVIIPKYAIKSIIEISESDFVGDKYVGDERFATRYFISTNGLPVKKGEHYGSLNLYGPEVHFAVSDNLSLGIMTTWMAMPIVGSAKYSMKLADGLHLGVGALAGTLSWIQPEAGGVLGYASLTLGNRRSNITFSGGYAFLTDGDYTETAPLLSIAGMTKVGKKTSLLVDSFIYTGNPENRPYNGSLAVITPGIRYAVNHKNSLQFGFTGTIFEGDPVPVPVPMFTWFRALN